eukprot:9471664-Pyramimonas_sp.AAC.1
MSIWLDVATVARSECPPVLSSVCLQSIMLEARESPAVDFATKRAGKLKEPSRPWQLIRAEEEAHACLKEEAQRLKQLKKEASRHRRGYRREMIACRCSPAGRNIIYRIKHLVADGRETEDREEWNGEIDKFVRAQ